MKDTTDTACQRNSSETAQQNFVKLCSCEGHSTMYRYAYPQEILILFFFSELRPFYYNPNNLRGYIVIRSFVRPSVRPHL